MAEIVGGKGAQLFQPLGKYIAYILSNVVTPSKCFDDTSIIAQIENQWNPPSYFQLKKVDNNCNVANKIRQEWFMLNMVIVRKWSSGTNIVEDALGSIPIWINLHGNPHDLQGQNLSTRLVAPWETPYQPRPIIIILN